MLDPWSLIALTPPQASALFAIAFCAGIVRGFTGFALSAFAMAIGVIILPPVELIPMLWWLEIAASLMMMRAGWAEADRPTALILAGTAALGVFFGLGLTVTLDPETSKRVALLILITLAALQLSRVRIPGLATLPGTVIAGLLAGLVTGLAGIGGMIVALFVLARAAEPRVMRATLVMYLLFSSAVTLMMHLWWGTMNATSTARGLTFILPCLLGVWLGIRLFTPRWQGYYKPACLLLLIGLGATSLMRSVI